MCKESNESRLSECESGYLCWCHSCQKYTLMYETSCVLFSQEEFKDFYRLLKSLTDDHFIQMNALEERVILRGNKAFMGVCFTRKQVKEVIELFARAKAMEEIYSIVYS